MFTSACCCKKGAIGISTGLIYLRVYSGTEADSLSKSISGLIYTSHMRSEGNELIESINEAIRVGIESGISVHISHIKTSGKANWHKIDDAISAIDNAREEGLMVTCDRYPYTAASTDLDAVLPSWAYAGGAEEEVRRLRDVKASAVIKSEILSAHPLGDYWDNIAISSVNSGTNKWMEGRSFSYISERAGKSPVDLVIDVLIEEN